METEQGQGARHGLGARLGCSSLSLPRLGLARRPAGPHQTAGSRVAPRGLDHRSRGGNRRRDVSSPGSGSCFLAETLSPLRAAAQKPTPWTVWGFFTQSKETRPKGTGETLLCCAAAHKASCAPNSPCQGLRAKPRGGKCCGALRRGNAREASLINKRGEWRKVKTETLRDLISRKQPPTDALWSSTQLYSSIQPGGKNPASLPRGGGEGSQRAVDRLDR